jgi:hypothetical protein
VLVHSVGSLVGGHGWSRAREGVVVRYRRTSDRVEVLLEPVVTREGRPSRPSRLRSARIRSALTAPVSGAEPLPWRISSGGGVSLQWER